MFFIPLNQVESVELVIHALRVAGGEADCSSCPVRRVCMKQCLTIAASVEKMAQEGALPTIELESDPSPEPQDSPASSDKSEKGPPKGSPLKVIK